MSAPSILFLIGFLIDNPKSGGQLIITNQMRKCREWGFDICGVSIYAFDEPPEKDGLCDLYIRVPRDSPFHLYKGRHIPWLGDYTIGKYGASIANDVTERLGKSFDIIVCEHPWLWGMADAMRRKMGKGKIVFGSQNVEGQLKRVIFKEYLHHPIDKDLFDEIDAIEKQAVLESDLTLTVGQGDADIFASWGGKNILVTPNGTQPLPPSAPVPPALAGSSYIAYVGSYHPPNVTGFFHLVGPDISYLPSGTKLAVIGSMKDMIVDDGRYKPFLESNADKIWLPGLVERDVLESTLINASAIIIPIESGGGTNLKTSEALVSGRPVIVTSFGMRGFEEYKSLPQVRICDDREAFQQAIRDVLTGAWSPVAAPVPTLTWDYCMAPLQQALLDLLPVSQRKWA